MRQNVHGDNYVDSAMAVPRMSHKFDDTVNENSKTWTVPTNEQWKITVAHAIYTSTATAGNRLIKIILTDPDGNSFDIHSGAVQAASNTYHYLFLQGIFRETSFVNGELQVPMPADLYLPPGWSITFKDDNDVDANDDMEVIFLYEKAEV